MPIKDVLWACPLCHQVEAIGRTGVCASCGTRFRRGRGARIVATAGKGHGAGNRTLPLELGVPEWLDRLPWPDLDGEGRALPAGLHPPFVVRVRARSATGEQPIRRGTDFLGMVERFGPEKEGELELTASSLGFAPGGSGGWRWSLVDLTAIQPASSSIQLKARGQPVCSVRFDQGSLRLWEQRLQYCVRRAYADAGRGEITEFQPRIRVR